MNNIKSFKNIIIVFSSLAASLFLLSCDGSQIASVEQAEHAVVTQTGTMAQQQAKQADPKDLSDAFFKMVEQVQQLSREELENMSQEELSALARPLLDAVENTVKLSDETLEKLNKVLAGLAESIHTITGEEHAVISREVEQIMAADAGRTVRSLREEDVREVLLKLNGGDAAMSATCEDLYNQWGGYVHIMPGDNLNIANSVCPAGSIFYVHSGTYSSQSVVGSKNGNLWVGVGGPVIMNGQTSVERAFNGGMRGNSISWIEILNYTDYGIFSESGTTRDVEIKNMTFRNIGALKDGQLRSAIFFEWTTNVIVRNSHFENVTSSIRIKKSNGPLQVLNNIAVNPGNCGIGVAGGQYFKVENNKIYSQQINGISNVGIYAQARPSHVSCNHGLGTFSGNVSRFFCGRNEPPPGTNCGIGSNNWAWAPNPGEDGYCGIKRDSIRHESRVKSADTDSELGPWIWNTW